MDTLFGGGKDVVKYTVKRDNISKDDIKALCCLYNQLLENDSTDIDAMEKVLAEIDGDEHYHLFCIYDENGIMLGTASLTRCFDLTGDCRCYYNMENFVVDRQYRRNGVGSFLLKQVEEYVMENNGRHINFTSSSTRKEAHLFYTKMGYIPDKVKGFKKSF